MNTEINLGEVAYILRALNWYEDRLRLIRDDTYEEEEKNIISAIREKLSTKLKDETYL